MTGSLAGLRVVVTREQPGELGELLERRGAEVVHVPLIRVTAPSDGGVALDAALAHLDRVEWLVVTSRAGAARVGDAARRHRHVRLAAVGSATARELSRLADRPVDVTPETQRGAALGAALNDHLGDRPARILLAQAEQADPTLAGQLRRAGHDLRVVAAYRTEHQVPRVPVVADAVLFSSGSAVEAWHAALGESTPPLTVAIGPTTAAVADRIGLKITAISADHSVKGLVEELERVVAVDR